MHNNGPAGESHMMADHDQAELKRLRETRVETVSHPARSGSGSNWLFMRDINWHTHLVDRFLHLVGTILLLIAAGILVLYMLLVNGSALNQQQDENLICRNPDLWTPAEADLARTYCLNSYGVLSRNNRSGDVFDRSSVGASTEDSIVSFLWLAVLCVIPLIAWRIIGNLDGASILTTHRQGGILDLVSPIWYLITRIGYCIVAGVVLGYLMAMDHTNDDNTQNIPVTCTYERNNVRFFLDCQYSVNISSPRYRLTQRLAKALWIFFLVLLILLIINAVVVLVVLILSFIKKYRDRVLRRMLGHHYADTDDDDRLNSMALTPRQTFVTVLGSRNGYGQRCAELLGERYRGLSVVSAKTQEYKVHH